MRAYILALCLASFTPAGVRAQLAESRILTLAAVKNAIAAAESEAKANGWKVSIAVVDAAGDLLGFLRMDGASLMSIQISQGKARTAARTKRPTRDYADRLTQGNIATLALDVMPLEGGVPIIVDGVAVGGIGVSGATSQQDAQCATKGVAAIKP
ncbi:MAG: hypothetical protein MNPFHGCM_00245 [Gemmatimonadaceae bacterium]|nr:hypothetical protein [Gemmatimonadaceae bacterium]